MKTGKKLFIISGPTAVGKTDFAIQMAQEFNCPVISADSRQVYIELNIGVAKPDEKQLQSVKHFFINHVSIHQPYNVGKYAAEARVLINELFITHEKLIVCGGTGLYINALLNGLDILPEKNIQLRNELEELHSKEGLTALQKKMQALNPEKYEKIDQQNPRRLMRAIEIEISDHPEVQNIPDFKHPFETEKIILELPRAELYDRINQRVDQMIEAGLEQEAFSFKEWQHLSALQTVGYTEWWPYFNGEVSKDLVIDKIKQHSRNYAKRQLTWIRNKG